MDFTKPARTWDEQIDLLRSRGLHIPDREQARHYLSHINYYRLTGYRLPFEADGSTRRVKAQTSFDDVLNLYIFDREFRLLLLDAIERIEVGEAPIPRRKPAGLISSFNPNRSRYVYNTAVMLAALMDIVSPGHLWKARLRDILSRHHISAAAMGFPEDWQQRPVWAELQENDQ